MYFVSIFSSEEGYIREFSRCINEIKSTVEQIKSSILNETQPSIYNERNREECSYYNLLLLIGEYGTNLTTDVLIDSMSLTKNLHKIETKHLFTFLNSKGIDEVIIRMHSNLTRDKEGYFDTIRNFYLCFMNRYYEEYVQDKLDSQFTLFLDMFEKYSTPEYEENYIRFIWSIMKNKRHTTNKFKLIAKKFISMVTNTIAILMQTGKGINDEQSGLHLIPREMFVFILDFLHQNERNSNEVIAYISDQIVSEENILSLLTILTKINLSNAVTLIHFVSCIAKIGELIFTHSMLTIRDIESLQLIVQTNIMLLIKYLPWIGRKSKLDEIIIKKAKTFRTMHIDNIPDHDIRANLLHEIFGVTVKLLNFLKESYHSMGDSAKFEEVKTLQYLNCYMSNKLIS